ncbi:MULTISPECIES: 3-phosphoshikimate 1-carboxyvinyltransferase [Rhizobium/Agrobacterium group]|jgi:3-phosphoshikimate 1-carboxyvinyltransferase|uniref:3-phosphoshikimate 1-carboxyvinyltransferase n=1 Tax=Rhizobium/Agrobacterium group TaxID=227290 RepID=UPI00023A2212|nr:MULTISPECIES: 3-phosphoshikimate 1-carboxyvinyltransferase [Rhizobium/Agrobacterium group]AHK00497.1 5-enolpyruvylshikimate-3-phosphate synthase [Agrobacterium tumefaciens LBA4213 (Ach5)]AKC06338.1 3-phosphoshikimate 1-carboxyvinyltransferase [Agrobacterium tumefaciens]EHJ98422.1 3-phosphoshikimate 1-carboxyvinyltransferase [Agrobacterium tumefaciens 5A]AYM15242.1 3-phosphoshikimate 1-carboxyvinyltransferase [Agrobacterium tumefaciens]AYM66478.1 3-phosphoshikimate 1-carboxyvinyltransferase 
MIELTITPPGHPLSGKVEPPGSKSITNRALLLAGLAKGKSRLTGALKSDDTLYMAEALRAMGVKVTEPDATTFVVEGTGVLQQPEKPLFLGNAGTATRFLTAAAALVDGAVIIDGDEHMRKRPIMPLVEALRALGVEADAPTGCPPVTVRGKGMGFPKGSVTIDANLSSQYVSALLMAAACGDKFVDIILKGEEIGAKGYIDLTTSAMEAFGAKIERVSNAIWRVNPTGYTATDFHIEPDASAATYLWGAELLTGGAIDIGTPADKFTQPDAKAYEVMAQFPHLPAEIDGSQMQDAIPTIAVLAAFNETPVRFVGIANLRVKECDRIRAVSLGLNEIRNGLAHEEGDDLIVHADPALAGQTVDASIDTFADHRIAMSFALAALKIGGIAIQNPACVGKTYPGYWKALASLGVDYTEKESAAEPQH